MYIHIFTYVYMCVPMHMPYEKHTHLPACTTEINALRWHELVMSAGVNTVELPTIFIKICRFFLEGLSNDAQFDRKLTVIHPAPPPVSSSLFPFPPQSLSFLFPPFLNYFSHQSSPSKYHFTSSLVMHPRATETRCIP